MEKEIMEALESAKSDLSKISNAIGEISEKFSESNKTTLDKLDEIELVTGVNLLVNADKIIRTVLNFTDKSMINQNQLTVKLLNEIGKFISNIEEINKLKEENKIEELKELIKKTRDRNIYIYDVLFETKTDMTNLSALKSKQKINEIEKGIVEQLSILCIEVLGEIFAGMLAMQNKDEKK